jgi:class 3 adenylate cyclase
VNKDITKSEYEVISSAIEKILLQPVEQIELSDSIPPISEMADSNKVFKGKLSILFVDMRKSTDLTDELKSKKMVKIYRSFIRLIIQAIRYSGGYSRQFAGDGVMGVFQDSEEKDVIISSAEKAIIAGRYILTLIDFCLNPALKKHMDIVVACGVGICTGTIMITKAGMRGKEADESVENELGIVWVGSTTNYASRFCSLAKSGEIFVDDITFKEANEDEIYWKNCIRFKADKSFEGYVAKDYYLNFNDDLDITPIKVTEEPTSEVTFIQDIFKETKSQALSIVDEIAQKSAALSMRLEELKKREEQLKIKENQNSQNESKLSQWQENLNSKQSQVDYKAKQNNINEYELNKRIYSITFLKRNLEIEMGRDFWDNHLKLLINLGAKFGKSEIEVKSEICYYLVDIYRNLNMYPEAYYALCIQAEYCSWIHDSTVEDIVKKTGYHSQLKEVIEKRILKPLDPDTRNYLVKCADKLKSLGY